MLSLQRGGAISAYSDTASGVGTGIPANGANVEIYDSTFESNTASEYGGAIMIGTASVDSGTLTIYDSTFQSNSAGER